MRSAGAAAAGNRLTVSPLGVLQVDAPAGPLPPASRLACELEWFDALNASSNILSIWEPQRALAVTALEAAMPNFAVAAEAAEGRGFAVHVRRSGGGCVCLGPGTLVISHLYGATCDDIDRSYRDFAAKLITAIARVHIPLRIGQVSGAYCDGRFDLNWNGLKVGGIAQRRRARAGNSNVWVHAVLSVEADSLRLPLEVATFYSDLGSERRVRDAATTALACCVSSTRPSAAVTADLMSRCTAAIVHVFGVTAARNDA